MRSQEAVIGLFGDITRTLFGGRESEDWSESTSETGNLNREAVTGAFMPWVSQGGNSLGMAANIMGLGGDAARSDALNDWWGSSGGDFMLNQGLDQVDAMYRSRGLGQSGAAMKAMEDYRGGLASTKMSEAMGNLFNISQQGLGAGGLVTDAGRYSTSRSQSEGSSSEDTGGFGGFLGSIFSSIPGISDPRAKTNIEKLGELPDGLGIYAFDYLPIPELTDYIPEGRQVGVMANEVADLRPWALGPEIHGYQSVNYGAL